MPPSRPRGMQASDVASSAEPRSTVAALQRLRTSDRTATPTEARVESAPRVPRIAAIEKESGLKIRVSSACHADDTSRFESWLPHFSRGSGEIGKRNRPLICRSRSSTQRGRRPEELSLLRSGGLAEPCGSSVRRAAARRARRCASLRAPMHAWVSLTDGPRDARPWSASPLFSISAEALPTTQRATPQRSRRKRCNT